MEGDKFHIIPLLSTSVGLTCARQRFARRITLIPHGVLHVIRRLNGHTAHSIYSCTTLLRPTAADTQSIRNAVIHPLLPIHAEFRRENALAYKYELPRGSGKLPLPPPHEEPVRVKNFDEACMVGGR